MSAVVIVIAVLGGLVGGVGGVTGVAAALFAACRLARGCTCETCAAERRTTTKGLNP